ncbi:MAG: cyclopropane-fatty-acyl-phospholipid synthase family protein [Alphaproteobacteria bacterium]|nr:cyclopropane-fatty-acyl-phospholipid synthase family protein [Alphaproteobacteria bacterium]
MTRLDRMIVEITAGDVGRLDGLPASFRLAAMLLVRFRKGRLDIIVPDGRTLRFEGPEEGPRAEIIVHDAGLARSVLAKGDIGFAEMFMDGKFDTPDLAAVLEYFTVNFERAGKLAMGGTLTRYLNAVRHALRSNTKRGSKRNILAHYDLGNEFYARWLDPSMTYSSALYSRPDQSLQDAQLAKYRAIATHLDLKPGMTVLEIGSGWGGFAEVAAREFGARVTSVTISNAQHDWAVKRIADAGLSGQVDIQLRDYRDLSGQFDAVASIEMFEAVGEKYWPNYFAKVAEILKPGAKAALQVITIEDQEFERYRSRPDFIQRYIFPGGMLPSIERLGRESARVGLDFRTATLFGQSYARTLAEWQNRFEPEWDAISRLGFDERFRRLWLYYLAYCQAGFRTGRIDVGHFVLRRPPG